VPLRSLASAGLPAVLGTHVFLEFHFPGLCWQTVLGFWCSRSFRSVLFFWAGRRNIFHDLLFWRIRRVPGAESAASVRRPRGAKASSGLRVTCLLLDSPRAWSAKCSWGPARRHDLQALMLLLQLDERLVLFSQLVLQILNLLRCCRGVAPAANGARAAHTYIQGPVRDWRAVARAAPHRVPVQRA